MPGYQDPLLGEPLTENADPCDLALNIHRFIAQFESDEDELEEGFAKEKIKIRKFKHLKAA